MLFRGRTSGLSLKTVQADEVDQGVSRHAWDRIAREHELSREVITTTYVLGPPEGMFRLEKDPDWRSDEGFLEGPRSQCLLFVILEDLLLGAAHEWTFQAIGVLLKRTHLQRAEGP